VSLLLLLILLLFTAKVPMDLFDQIETYIFTYLVDTYFSAFKDSPSWTKLFQFLYMTERTVLEEDFSLFRGTVMHCTAPEAMDLGSGSALTAASAYSCSVCIHVLYAFMYCTGIHILYRHSCIVPFCILQIFNHCLYNSLV
jgi:hypothetical protein